MSASTWCTCGRAENSTEWRDGAEFRRTFGADHGVQYAEKPSNVDVKILVRHRVEAMLSPAAITDRDVVMMFDDAAASFQWGFWFQGQQYRALFERWFDDLWSNIPDSYLIYSRNGFKESVIDRIREGTRSHRISAGSSELLSSC